VRIISGSAGGRKLIAPEGRDVRPTSDKVRGAIFNALGSRVEITGAQAIDCFCGSGALGLEALSRGAASCVFVDNNRKSLDLAKENAKNLGLDAAAEFLFSDSAKLTPRAASISIAFLDPPYRKNLIVPALSALSDGGWLVHGAVCAVEAEKEFKEMLPGAFELLDEKIYGDTKVLFLQFSR